jgi:hypothetical protein
MYAIKVGYSKVKFSDVNKISFQGMIWKFNCQNLHFIMTYAVDVNVSPYVNKTFSK